jgi:hypothetical protein
MSVTHRLSQQWQCPGAYKTCGVGLASVQVLVGVQAAAHMRLACRFQVLTW